jgi:acyl carrier protein
MASAENITPPMTAVDARDLLARALEVDPSEISDDASIDSVDLWDSIAHLRIIIAIEEALNRELDPESIVVISSIEDIARILKDKCS